MLFFFFILFIIYGKNIFQKNEFGDMVIRALYFSVSFTLYILGQKKKKSALYFLFLMYRGLIVFLYFLLTCIPKPCIPVDEISKKKQQAGHFSKSPIELCMICFAHNCFALSTLQDQRLPKHLELTRCRQSSPFFK